jgi:hypothetical protein
MTRANTRSGAGSGLGRDILGVVLPLAVGMAAGGLSGGNDWVAVLVAAMAAFGAGRPSGRGWFARSRLPRETATIGLIWLVVCAGQGLPPDRALAVGALALTGGLLQTASLWHSGRCDPTAPSAARWLIALALPAIRYVPSTTQNPARAAGGPPA